MLFKKRLPATEIRLETDLFEAYCSKVPLDGQGIKFVDQDSPYDVFFSVLFYFSWKDHACKINLLYETENASLYLTLPEGEFRYVMQIPLNYEFALSNLKAFSEKNCVRIQNLSNTYMALLKSNVFIFSFDSTEGSIVIRLLSSFITDHK